MYIYIYFMWEICKRKANWIGHILHTNCLLQQVTEVKIKGEIEVTGKRGRRRRKLLDHVKERRGYSHLNEEALDRTMWRARFARGFGPVLRQTAKWNEIYIYENLPFLFRLPNQNLVCISYRQLVDNKKYRSQVKSFFDTLNLIKWDYIYFMSPITPISVSYLLFYLSLCLRFILLQYLGFQQRTILTVDQQLV
jgi:hypothetical protein